MLNMTVMMMIWVLSRRLRSRNSSQDEVSDPDERADLHYDGHLDAFDNERMIGFSRANRVRLERARVTLMARHDDAANQMEMLWCATNETMQWM